MTGPPVDPSPPRLLDLLRNALDPTTTKPTPAPRPGLLRQLAGLSLGPVGMLATNGLGLTEDALSPLRALKTVMLASGDQQAKMNHAMAGLDPDKIPQSIPLRDRALAAGELAAMVGGPALVRGIGKGAQAIGRAIDDVGDVAGATRQEFLRNLDPATRAYATNDPQMARVVSPDAPPAPRVAGVSERKGVSTIADSLAALPSRAEFLGKPRITTQASASELRPNAGLAAKQPPESFMEGRYTIRRLDSQPGDRLPGGRYAVYDGDKVIASYDGSVLAVDKAYRRQGIATDLMADFHERHPDVRPGQERTKISQKVVEKAYEILQRKNANKQ